MAWQASGLSAYAVYELPERTRLRLLCIDVSPDSSLLVAGGADAIGADGGIAVWSLHSHSLMTILELPGGATTQLTCLPSAAASTAAAPRGRASQGGVG